MPNSGFNWRKSTERDYVDGLAWLKRQIHRAIKNRRDLDELLAFIRNISATDQWKDIAYQQSARMVKSVAVNNAKSWQDAAMRGTRAREINTLLRNEFNNKTRFWDVIDRNSELIKTMPQGLANEVSKRAARMAVDGRRASAIYDEIKTQAPKLAEYQIKRVARTEIAKAQATITEIRSGELGIDWFVWNTVQDARVRSAHEHMQGVACQYSAPPSPEKLDGGKFVGFYCPGSIWNCRCFAAPIVDVDLESYPLKVVQSDQIVRLTKRQFLDLAG